MQVIFARPARAHVRKGRAQLIDVFFNAAANRSRNFGRDKGSKSIHRLYRLHSTAEPQPKQRRVDLQLRRSRMFIDNRNQMTVSSFRSEMFKEPRPRDLHYAPKGAIEHL